MKRRGLRSFSNFKGFMLIEIMIVVLIIIILAMIAIPAYKNLQIKSRRTRAITDLRAIALALDEYYIDWNQYPIQSSENIMSDSVVCELTGGREGGGATININGHFSSTGDSGPICYIESIPYDPFVLNSNTRYYYYCDSRNGPWYVWSVGPNGTNDHHSGDDVVRSSE